MSRKQLNPRHLPIRCRNTGPRLMDSWRRACIKKVPDSIQEADGVVTVDGVTISGFSAPAAASFFS